MGYCHKHILIRELEKATAGEKTLKNKPDKSFVLGVIANRLHGAMLLFLPRFKTKPQSDLNILVPKQIISLN